MSSEPKLLTLRERLIRDDAIIKSIIDAIPPKYYFDRDVLDQLEDSKMKIGDRSVKGFKGNKFGFRAKHKRHRLNPLHQKTVSQIIEELDVDEKKNDEKNDTSAKGNIEELQQRLKKKIQAMKAARQGSGKKRAHEIKRGAGKVKQKEKRKKKNYTKVANTLHTENKDGVLQKVPQSRVFNKEGTLIYSKFDLGSSKVSDKKDTSLKSNLKKSMKELKKREEKLQKLQEQSSEKAEEFKSKILWQQALNKSEGVKVKDNPELLKKSAKRQEQRKRKSQKQWKSRTEQVEKKKKEKQDKRTQNIQNRKNDKMKRKLKKAAKKGRLIPGF